MIAAIVAIFVIAAETTVTQALKDSACFTCMSKKQMLQALVTILGNNILGENASQQEILNMLACLRCASERQLMAAALYLLCHEFALERQGI